MRKFHKYLSIIVPFFLAIGIQIGTGIICGLIYSIVYLIFLLLSRWEFIKGGGVDFNIILDKMTIIENLYLIKILSILSTIICIIVFYQWIRKYYPQNVNSKIFSILSLKNISLLLILSFGYGLLEIGALNLVIYGFHNASQNYINMMNKLYSGNQIVTLLYLTLIAPISEELIFRGVILKKACNELTFIGANILQSILFGIYHMNIIQGTCAFIAGLLLGYIAFKYKTVMASIVLHSFLNFNLSGFLLRGLYPSTTKYIISCVIGLVLLLIVMRIIKKQEI